MLKVFAVRDVKAEAYGNLICVNSRGLAVRAFAEACEDKNSPFAKYPADYSLYLLGEFDSVSGLIKPNIPEYVISAVEIISPKVETVS